MAETDERARLRAPKLAASRRRGDADLRRRATKRRNQLPFVQAPVNPTGASSPTSSPTTVQLKREANFSLPCSTDAALARLTGLNTRNQAQHRCRS
jgi:hypothetical protein